MNNLNRILGICIALSVCAPLANADSAVHRCVENGKTIFSDTPCPGSGAVVDTPTISSANKSQVRSMNIDAAYDTPYGDWRGQVQYQATEKGQRVESAHSVIPFVLSIANDGRVTGISQENGCKYLGIAMPGVIPTMVNLDLTLTNCAYRGMNKRYSGSLVLNSAAKVAQLSLSGMDAKIGAISTYDIKATLRR